MKRLFLFLIFFWGAIATDCFSQEGAIHLGDGRLLEIGGWVRSEFIYNTRGTVEAVDGLFSLYPLNVSLDDNGDDINGNPSIAMSSIATRFSTTFSGGRIGNADVRSYVEFDFTAKSSVNSIMFRQGWISLTWEKSQLFVGRAWHPLSTYSMPHVKNLSFGAPFFAFNRSEQVRYSYLPGNFTLSATTSYQGQYASFGPYGRSDQYMRNALIPEMSLAAIWQNDNLKFGIVGNTKTILPRQLVSGTNGMTTATSEKLTTFSAQTFAEFTGDFISLRMNGSYTQNNAESSMLGGYAVSTLDVVTGFEEYTPSQHLNGWVSIDMGDKLKYGFFAGHSVNLGTLDPIVGSFFGRGYDIASISRLSPQISYQIDKLSLGAELEFTRAWYGTPHDMDRGRVRNIAPANNTRLQIMAFYYF